MTEKQIMMDKLLNESKRDQKVMKLLSTYVTTDNKKGVLVRRVPSKQVKEQRLKLALNRKLNRT